MEERISKILICDDHLPGQAAIKTILSKYQNISLTFVTTGNECINAYDETFDLVILDVRLPDTNGMDVLKQLISMDSDAIIIIMTAYSTEEIIIRSLRTGAFNYIKKPYEAPRFISAIKEAIEYKKNKSGITKQQVKKVSSNIINKNDLENYTDKMNQLRFSTKSEKIIEIQKTIKKIASKKISILLTGESGTGKEYYAKYIHSLSPRSNTSFIPVNCPAIPKTLVESELFGHEKGSFTGAISTKIGKFESANNGVLFLDEIADLDMDSQSKILRAIQEREIEKVGSIKKIPVDVLLISATSTDLKTHMKQQLFRPDLFYRIADIELELPSFRDHLEDMPTLIEYFCLEYAIEHEEPCKMFSDSVIEKLKAYHWPGNIRELKSIVRRIIILSDSNLIELSEAGYEIEKQFMKNLQEKNKEDIDDEMSSNVINFNAPTNKFNIKDNEKLFIEQALKENNYNMALTSEKVGISRSTLYRKMKKYNINIRQTS